MHKEEYFTRENIAAAAASMAGSLPVKHHAAALAPERAALLIIDMQDYFLHAESHAFLPAAAAIIPNIMALLTAFNQAGRPAFFTRHANNARDAGQMAAWWRELLTPDHPLGAITTVFPVAENTVIVKSQYDAFFHTDLEWRLRQGGAEQLVITGVATHLCCESTARSAFSRGFAVFMAIDGTATLNRELHVASLRGLAHGCAVPLRAVELLAAMVGAS